MRRLAIIAAWLVLLAGAAAAQSTSPASAPVAKLKREVVVSGALVRIGDLLDDAGPAADIAIFRAPDIGETGEVPAYRVLDAVRPYGVTVDTAGNTEVAVTRAGRVMTAGVIEASIARLLAPRAGVADPHNLGITLDGEPPPLRLPDTSGDLRAAQVNYNARSGRFDIIFELPASGMRRAAVRYTGTAMETVAVAVVARPLARGEIVKAGDVVIERRPKSAFHDDLSEPSGNPVGLAVRRQLRPGQALHVADLMKPEIVQRNEEVTLIYEVPGLTLTARGKAIDAGAEGDLVNVLNTQSKRTVQGTVAGPARVIVRTVAPRLAAGGDMPPTTQPDGTTGRTE
jgi:flagellar basal body P-ring formation protein FlgA